MCEDFKTIAVIPEDIKPCFHYCDGSYTRDTENLQCVVTSGSLYFSCGDEIWKVKTSRYKMQIYITLYTECSKRRDKRISGKQVKTFERIWLWA